MTDKAWLVMQQGATSNEWYAYASVDMEDIDALRRDGWEEGGCSTTAPVEIPAEALGDRGLLLDIAEAVAAAVSERIVRGALS